MKAIISIIFFISIQVVSAQGEYYLVTDQAFYFPKEEIRISVLKSGSSNSEVVTLMICDDGSLLMRSNVLVSNGIGSVQLTAPRNASSGKYTIDLYNQTGHIGSSTIRIIEKTDENPLKEIEDAKSINETITINLKDTVTTEELSSVTITAGDDELTSLSVSITNRNPKVNVFKGFQNGTAENGVPIKGILKDENGDILANHSFMMVAPQVNKFYSGQSDGQGYFELFTKVDLSTYDGVFLSFSPQIHQKIQVELIQNSCENSQMESSNETVSAKRDLVNTVINEAFSPFVISDDNAGKKTDYSEYYDREVRPAEYTSSSMFQVFNDIVPKVHVKGNKFGMYALESTTKLKVPPLIFVNGKPTYNYDYILAMNVEDVESIGVIASFKSLRKFFQAGNGGIIEINTKGGDVIPAQSNNILSINGIDPPISEDVRISGDEVSFSSLLLYESVFQLLKNESKTIEFKTTLESGPYYFIASGVTLSGRAFHQVVPFYINQAIANQ